MKINLQDNKTSDISYIKQSFTTDEWSFLEYLSTSNLGKVLKDNLVFSFHDKNENAKFNILQLLFEKKDAFKIQTSCVCGFLGYHNCQIRIHSRFGDSKRDYFLHYMLMKVLKQNFVLLTTDFDRNSDAIYDCLMFIFPILLKKAMSKGLMKLYIHKDCNSNIVKGRIDVPRHQRQNIPFTGKIAYSLRDYSMDNYVMHLLRAVLEVMYGNSIGRSLLGRNDSELQECIQTIKNVTPSYGRHSIDYIIGKVQNTTINSLYKDYIELIDVSIKILQRLHKKGNYSDGNDKIYGILFDAAWLWEKYVAIVIQEQMEHLTRSNHKTEKLFDDNGTKTQEIVPDYLSKNKGVVADAKYIPLNQNHGKSTAAPAAMDRYYKTIMYMYRFGTKLGLLIYPDDEKNHFRNGEYVNLHSKKILGPLDGEIKEIGLKVDSEMVKNYDDFCIEMGKVEKELCKQIQKILNNEHLILKK